MTTPQASSQTILEREQKQFKRNSDPQGPQLGVLGRKALRWPMAEGHLRAKTG